MSKKLKITEEQLKRLIGNKKNIEEQVEGDGMDNGNRLRTKESILIEFENKFNELISLSKKIDELNLGNRESWREWITNDLISLFGGENNPFEGQRGGPTVSSLIDDELGRNPEEEDEYSNDEPNTEFDESIHYEINESVIKIKSEFNRFL